jgi:hypothetical protein
MYTEFDWRIGVLNGQALYACQYFMSRGHWQIYNHGQGQSPGVAKSAASKPCPSARRPAKWSSSRCAPPRRSATASTASTSSRRPPRVAVIEVNDNPSIDAGVEDAYLGEDLYRRIMEEFLRRLERKRLGIGD